MARASTSARSMLLPLLLCGSAGALRVPRRAALRNLAAAGVAPLVAAPPAGAAPAEVFAARGEPPGPHDRHHGRQHGPGPRVRGAPRRGRRGRRRDGADGRQGSVAVGGRRTGKRSAVELDLGDLKSVSSFPARLPKDVTKVDVLMENAGVMAIPTSCRPAGGGRSASTTWATSRSRRR
ncbi:hypothetical protein JL722_9478 [Aureococcus anophagefferens]|nr:hypothetical protein JL722_9478 [Aureococcus anophagefferens]